MAADDSMKKFGDWNLARFLTRNLKVDMQRVGEIGLRRIGLAAERDIKLTIRKQPSSWAPLNEDYKKSKARRGLSTKTLIATSTYFQKITSFSTKHLAAAGVKRNAKTRDGEDLVSIAATHEYGSKKRGIPERPVYRPVFGRIKVRIAKGEFFSDVYTKMMLKKYGIRPKKGGKI